VRKWIAIALAFALLALGVILVVAADHRAAVRYLRENPEVRGVPGGIPVRGIAGGAPASPTRGQPRASDRFADMASIFVAIEVTTTKKPLLFRFSYRDLPPGRPLPKIRWIRVGRVGQPEVGCTLQVIDQRGPLIQSEWIVGDVPPNYRSEGCVPLTPGQYEAYVDAEVGDGIQRFNLGADGSIRLLPWDELEDPSQR
jgi:hypothetical protein